MTIKGIIFDFDGLICDSESTELRAWEKLFSEYGLEFPFSEYQKTIGAIHNDETPLVLLKESGGDRIDLEDARQKIQDYHHALIEIEPLRPGVLDYLVDAREIGLKIGLASSSPISWVGHHLTRLKIRHFFKCIKTYEDVEKTKPDPKLYLLTLEGLGLTPGETIALEDSPNGVAASRAAGLITIAVPNAVTRQFSFSDADLTIYSLNDLSLRELLERFSNN
jgi:HAD superfamily hydrolase (TIGR01509 family)